MSDPHAIDPHLLAAEIEASVAESDRLAALAAEHHIAVLAEVQVQPMVERPSRPVLAVQVVSP